MHWARQHLVNEGVMDGSVRGLWSLTGAAPERPLPVVRKRRQTRKLVPQTARTREDTAANKALASSDALMHTTHKAMQQLGFDTSLVGSGGRRSGVLAKAELGQRRYSVLLVSDGTAAADYDVDYVCIVNATISELVQLHAKHPVTLLELRSFFAASPDSDRALASIRTAAERRAADAALFQHTLRLLDDFSRKLIPIEPNALLGGLAMLQPPVNPPPTRADVERALDLIELMGITQRNGDGSYTVQTSLAGAQPMLSAYLSGGGAQAG